ncbi:MAG: Ppx/GppA family phosphatase [Nitrospirae bacterium]|nr:Ppx/GppA family phosphatase [Nitrospirota bacterium]
MRLAAIDVGSNTLRLLIADIHDRAVSRILSERAITRLAGGIGDSGMLGKENMRKSISALNAFTGSMARHGVTRVKAVGTSALREAKNSGEFIRKAFRATGIRVEVISGTREAELTAKGILMGFGKTEGSLILDIGGGSTEWVLSRGNDSSRSPVCGTLPLGVVALRERFMRSDPPSADEIALLTEEVDSRLLPLRREVPAPPFAPLALIGTGGTVTTLAGLDLGLKEYDPEKVHRHRMSLTTLLSLRDLLLLLPREKRQSLDGLEPGRADLIIPGILLTIRFMDFFGFPEIAVSDYGLLEALIKEMYDENGF